MPLPNILEFAGTNITQRKFQQAQAKLLNFVGELDARQAATANGYFKSYTDLVAANNDISNIPLGVTVRVNSLANGGDYYKSTENATTLTKSAYDPLTQAKAYTDTEIINSNEYSYSTTDIFEIAYNPISGAIVNTTASNPAVLVGRSDGKYIKLDVRKFKSITVSNAILQATWNWVFTDANLNRISISSFYGNGVLVVPANAVWAYRTYAVDGLGVVENLNMTIFGSAKVAPLQAQIFTLENELQYLANGSPFSNVDIAPISGAIVNTTASNPAVLVGISDGKYIKINVYDIESINITGARIDIATWNWVFTDANLNRISISSFYGNGVLVVPANAVWAYRTYAVENLGSFELETIAIEVKSKSKSVEYVYVDLKEDISKLELSAQEDNGFYSKKVAMMTDAFNSGNVLKISDFPAATRHEQIDAAIAFIKKRGWGILDMESGVWLRNSAVLLPDNCWIYLNEATVKLADGVFDNVFRNDGIIPNPNPFEYALELRENKNIRVFGKSKDLAKVSGPDVPYTAPHPINGGTAIPWVGDFYGWRTLPILLANVKDYKLHDFAMEKTTCWAISQEHGCENFEVYNIGFNTSVKNGDGIDIRQGCKNGKVYNISGNTGDDMVALSAIQNFIVQHPSGNYIYPMQVGGYGDRGFGGDIEDIQINSISGRGLHNGVRLLASGGSKLKKISVDNISDKDGTFNGAIVLVSSGYGAAAQMGDMTNITVNGIESNFSQTPLNVSGPIKDSSFNKIRQKKSTGVLYTNTATFDNTEITNASYV